MTLSTPIHTELKPPRESVGQHPSLGRHGTARLSIALDTVSIIAAAGTTLLPNVLAGPPAMQGSARGTAAVVFLAAVVLLGAVIASARGGVGVHFLWGGSVAYLLYNAVMLVFATPYNRLFLAYLGMLGLAIFSLIRFVRLTRRPVSTPRGPRRVVAGYLVVTAALNAGLWLSTIVPSIWSPSPGTVVDGLGVATNPVWVQDLAFWIPAMIIVAHRLWSGHAGATILAGSALVFAVLESVSIAVDQAFGVAADPTSPVVSLAVVPIFVVLALVATGMAVFLGAVSDEPS